MRKLLGGVLMGLCLLAGTVPAADAAAPEPLLVTYVRSNADYWDIAVAVEKGFFAQEGFAPEFVANSGSVQSTQLLLTQAVQLAVAQPESLVAAIARGSRDLGGIAAPMRRVDWVLVGQKDTKSLADLKGKSIGFSGLRVSEFWLTQRALHDAGLPDGSFTGLQIGTTVAKYAALAKGSIAAAVLFQPTASQAIQAGYTKLTELGRYPDYIPGMYVVNRRWAAVNEHGMRMARALQHAHDWLYDPKNKAEAIAIMKKSSNASEAALEDVYKTFFVDPQWYTKHCEVDTSAIAEALRTLEQHHELDPARAPAIDDILLPANLGGRRT